MDFARSPFGVRCAIASLFPRVLGVQAVRSPSFDRGARLPCRCAQSLSLRQPIRLPLYVEVAIGNIFCVSQSQWLAELAPPFLVHAALHPQKQGTRKFPREFLNQCLRFLTVLAYVKHGHGVGRGGGVGRGLGVG